MLAAIIWNLLNFLAAQPLLVVVIIWIIYNKWQSSQPWPDFGGRITSIHSLAEWDALLESAAEKKQVVVMDAYATWCPPCKAAAPIFAQMSEQFTEESTIFAKVNVDEARDVSKRLGISAMPTFKFFKDKKELEQQQGWPGEDQLRRVLKYHGAKEAPPAAKKAD